MRGDNKSNLLMLLVFVASVLYYLPLIPRQFMGDDWMWLANAKLALTDYTHFFSRSMYGYLRPLNMIFHSLMISLFGLNAIAYGVLSVLLHSTNIALFWLLLKKMTSNNLLILSALIVFGFYCLDYSAIGWISVNHDLFVTGLSLLFALFMLDFSANPNKRRFVVLFGLAVAATLFKESGLVTVGLYFIILLLNNKSPLSKQFIWYSIILSAASLFYVIIYFVTRTYVDKEVILSFQVIINLWYYLIYLLLPVPERALRMIPPDLLGYIKVLKIILTFAIPAVLIYLFWKGDKVVRLFLMWLVVFLAPVSLFNLGINLFDLSPHMTISRFMYSAIPGLAVVVAAIISKLFSGKGKAINVLLSMFLLIFLIGNWLIIKKSSEIFVINQKLSRDIENSFNNIKEQLMRSDRVYILESSNYLLPEIIKGCFHLEAIAYVLYDKVIDVNLVTKAEIEPLYSRGDAIVLFYQNSDVSDVCLIPLEPDAGIYPARYNRY